MGNIELLTVQEVSEQLRVNKNFVYKLINEGRLKAVKGLGKTKIQQKEVDKLIKECIGD